MSTPKFTTRDIGLAIRDHIESELVHRHIEHEGVLMACVPAEEFTFVDVSDPSNLIILLSNGQRFKAIIVAEG